MSEKFGHFIGGVEVDSVSGDHFESINPWTREAWATVALGGLRASRLDASACTRAAGRSGRHDCHGHGSDAFFGAIFAFFPRQY